MCRSLCTARLWWPYFLQDLLGWGSFYRSQQKRLRHFHSLLHSLRRQKKKSRGWRRRARVDARPRPRLLSSAFAGQALCTCCVILISQNIIFTNILFEGKHVGTRTRINPTNHFNNTSKKTFRLKSAVRSKTGPNVRHWLIGLGKRSGLMVFVSYTISLNHS